MNERERAESFMKFMLYNSRKSNYYKYYDSREAWLKGRKKYLCASDSACVIGCGFNSNVWLWEDKTGRRKDNKVSDEALRRMELGSESEAYIRELFRLDHGIDSIHDGANVLVVNTEIKDKNGEPFMACTLDGVGIDKDGDPFILEIKRSESPKQFGEDPPLKYRAQVLKQMLVTGIRKACLCARIVWFDSSNKRHVTEKEYWFDLDKDESLEYDMECLKNAEIEFWNNHVLTNICPPELLPQL